MRRQLVPGLVVRLTVIKAKTRPGIEARLSIRSCLRTVDCSALATENCQTAKPPAADMNFITKLALLLLK